MTPEQREEVLPPLYAAQNILGQLQDRVTESNWHLLADARDEISKAIHAINQLPRGSHD